MPERRQNASQPPSPYSSSLSRGTQPERCGSIKTVVILHSTLFTLSATGSMQLPTQLVGSGMRPATLRRGGRSSLSTHIHYTARRGTWLPSRFQVCGWPNTPLKVQAAGLSSISQASQPSHHARYQTQTSSHTSCGPAPPHSTWEPGVGVWAGH